MSAVGQQLDAVCGQVISLKLIIVVLHIIRQIILKICLNNILTGRCQLQVNKASMENIRAGYDRQVCMSDV